MNDLFHIINNNILIMSTFVSLCSPHKKLNKNTVNYVINSNTTDNTTDTTNTTTTTTTHNNNNKYINVHPISKEKLKNFLYRLDQLPFIDEMYQNDEYQNMYASFDNFSIIYMDNEKNFIKNQSITYKSTTGKLCSCFTKK
ncbi:unnamed protein product [Schistosoma rodhaini]|nr:unnamed protein product [Schistosoma rodhaini]